MENSAYLSRGVSATKDEVKNAVKAADAGIFPQAFCKIVPDLAKDQEYCTVMHADGAGTKSSLAYMMYKETQDISYLASIAQDSLFMNTDDLACIGAVDGFMMSNTIGRNAHRIPGTAIAAIINRYEELGKMLREQGINIDFTGGETADVGDLVQTLIVDSTVMVRLKRDDVIDFSKMKPGLVIVGLASDGQTSYEDKENSGMGSNGLTAARHLLLKHDYYSKYPESYANTIEEAKVYVGKYGLGDSLSGTSLSIGEAILSPTRTYLPVIKSILDLYRDDVAGMVHCTGGGQTKCRDFGKGIHYIKNNLFSAPALFKAIYDGGEIAAKEMYQVFNMGHRLELYVPEKIAEAIIKIAATYNLKAQVIGRTEQAKTEKNELSISSEWGSFTY